MTDTERKNIWYFGLEPLRERYTYQLSNEWTPESYKGYDVKFISLYGKSGSGQIKNGQVLDAVDRGIYSMSQVASMLKRIDEVQDGDVILLQDFWTPGIEAVFYALDLYGIKVKLYSMLHAQSVDEYDFTYHMRKWMRGFELGMAARHDGIFVGSSIHKEQLRAIGFECGIHVVGLPIHKRMAMSELKHVKPKKNQIVFTSRYDKEKNPYFMLEVAKQFLSLNPSWEWIVTTSGSEFRSSLPGFVDYMYEFAKNHPGFVMKKGLSKEEYYEVLSESKIQFNSSLQDYVSWTVIESTMFGCDICYPNFRSFPEFVDEDRMYKPFDVFSALKVLSNMIIGDGLKSHPEISQTCDLGRRLEAEIVVNGSDVEYNVWHEKELIKNILK